MLTRCAILYVQGEISKEIPWTRNERGVLMLKDLTTKDFFENVFDGMLDDGFFKMPEENVMKTDIVLKDDTYIFDIELPGYKKEDITIALDDGVLSVSASVNTNVEEKDAEGKLIHSERHFGSCKRVYHVGKDITKDDVTASFADGVLHIFVQAKKEEKKASRIEIM